jgi:hypothetical protein
MFDRFCRYRAGTTTLADAANFCLTVLELTAYGRLAAARHYNIAKTVLNKLADLAATKGGYEARKARGAQAEFTGAEPTMARRSYQAHHPSGGGSCRQSFLIASADYDGAPHEIALVLWDFLKIAAGSRGPNFGPKRAGTRRNQSIHDRTMAPLKRLI